MDDMQRLAQIRRERDPKSFERLAQLKREQQARRDALNADNAWFYQQPIRKAASND